MPNCISAPGESGDLFGEMPLPRRDLVARNNPTPALTTAHVLCRQLRRKQARPEKYRIAHLICLNLLSMLKRSSR